MTPFRLLDLFSGIGGFSLGLERSGAFKTVAFCEIDPFCRKVLAKHWPEVPQYDDIRTLTAERLAADGIAVDAICGGFPCQDISAAGRKAGIEGDTRSGLYREVIRLARDIRPRIAIMENVAALLSGPSDRPGGWFGRILGDLAEIGFDAEWHSIPASHIGANHRRDRVWIIAYAREARPKQHAPVAEYWELELRHGGGNAPQRAIADAAGFGQSRSGGASQSGHSTTHENRQASQFKHELGWPTESPVRRADDGVPARLDADRIAALGNAVVPQIPELIGRAIAQAEGMTA